MQLDLPGLALGGLGGFDVAHRIFLFRREDGWKAQFNDRGGRRKLPNRVPDAVQRSSRCSEPGPYHAPTFVTAPALQRTATQGLRAALRPGQEAAQSHPGTST